MNLRLVGTVCAVLLLVAAFQNCDKSMRFAGNQQALSKSGAEENPDDPQHLPPVAQPEEEDVDHEGKRLQFRCVSGAKSDLSDLVDAGAGLGPQDDKSLVDTKHFGQLVIEKARRLDVVKMHGSLLVKKADSSALSDLHGIKYSVSSKEIRSIERPHSAVLALRSLDLQKVDHVRSAVMVAASREIDSITDVRAAFVCLSGEKIGSIQNVHGAGLKVVGREDGAGKASADLIDDLRGFVSLSKLKITKINNVHGYLIIRDAEIDEINNVRGHLILINSKVKKLSDVEGIVRTKASSIDAEIDVKGQRLPL